MGELLLTLLIDTSSLDGVYRETDSGAYYQVSQKQIAISGLGKTSVPERVKLKDKNLLLKGHYIHVKTN